MGMVLCCSKRHTGKVIIIGNSLKALTMLTIVFKTIVEKIAREKELTSDEAIEFVLECIEDSVK